MQFGPIEVLVEILVTRLLFGREYPGNIHEAHRESAVALCCPVIGNIRVINKTWL